jgi:hypothetical protein
VRREGTALQIDFLFFVFFYYGGNMRRALMLLSILSSLAAFAQDEQRPALRAVRIPDGSVRMDGKLEESCWSLAQPASGFVQSVPDTRKPSSERTEVRVLYDSERLYFGAWCFARDAKSIRYYEYFRDFGVYNTDTFEIALDTFHDRRNCFAFATNPLGAMLDLEYSNNGGTSNRNWDAVWEVKSEITAEGYFLEVAIPFKSLRYPQVDGDQLWGLNFQRRIRHRNEQSFWSFVPRPFSVPRISFAGTLTGLTNLPRARNLKLTPYGRTGFTTTPGEAGGTEASHAAGLDLKYGIGNALTLDVTLNPDFSNVGADVQQVNLTRFDLFFPERRPFFLENATIFDIRRTRRGNGVASSYGSNATLDLIPFFSRTIGLSSNGLPLPVWGGARMTGRLQSGFDFGVLNIYSRENRDLPGEGFTVVRARKKFLANSDAGFILTDRQTLGSNRFNRLLGTDLHFQFARYLDLSGLVMTTLDSGKKDGHVAWSGAASWRSSFWDWDMGYLDIQDNFNPEMGFVPRRGIRKSTGSFSVHPRLDRFSIREYAPYVRSDYILDQQNTLVTRLVSTGVGLIFRNGATLDVSRDGSFERLTRPFAIGGKVLVPVGDYSYENWKALYTSDISRRVSGSLGAESGDFYAGTKRTATTGLTLHPDEHLTSTLTYSQNRVSQPTGRFTSHLVGLRLDYGFSPRMFFNAFIQYNSLSHQFNTNLRFDLIHHPLSNLYVTYSDIRDTLDSERVIRILAIKFTQMLQF